MREGAKTRLTGAVVLVALAVIFVPMFFEERTREPPGPTSLSLPSVSPPGSAPASASRGTGARAPLGSESPPLPVGSGAGFGELLADSDEPPAWSVESRSGVVEDQPPMASGLGTPPGSSPVPAPSQSDRTPARASDGVAASRAAPPPRTGPPSWVVQVASLGTRESAAELETRLRDAGFSAFVEKADVNGRTFYRVRVGPELDRARAEQTATRLRARFKVDTLIHKYP